MKKKKSKLLSCFVEKMKIEESLREHIIFMNSLIATEYFTINDDSMSEYEIYNNKLTSIVCSNHKIFFPFKYCVYLFMRNDIWKELNVGI